MAAAMKQFSKTFVWILMGMLIVGLAGFGAVNFTGSMNAVALVGDEEVSTRDYARELQREQQALQVQTGQPMPMTQLAALGLDRVVLNRLITIAALDNEVNQLGISTGDANLLNELTQIPAFQNINGEFDRETYKFALENAGLTESAFEDDLRRESARTLVQGAIMSGARMPDTLPSALTDYIGARRSFSYIQLSPDDIVLTAVMPTDEELKAFYDESIDAFTLPETKSITYAVLRPDMLIDEVEVDEAALRALFDERSDQYQVPERRLVERLVFADEEAASSAKAQLELGGATFETLVADRGLALQDVDLGDVTMGDLAEAGQDVFSAQVGEVVGPLPSNLGPALFRINGRLEARFTSFEDAEADLRTELAADRARRLIEGQAENIDDLLAGGATLEDLADETDLEVGKILWTGLNGEGIAAYEGFRTAASAVTSEDFPEAAFLDDGSIFALRLDEVLPPRPEPFEDAREKVATAWQANRVATALEEQADSIVSAYATTGGFPEGHEVLTETGLTRTAYLDTTPADMMNQIFEMEPGAVAVVSDAESTVIVRLDDVLPPEESNEMTALSEALSAQLDQSLSQALFQAYAQDVQMRAAPRVDQQALNAVMANFQ